MSPTPISQIFLEGMEFFIKRDDLFDPHLAGNKFRKLYTLLQTPKQNLKKIISYGGTQSNAMVAIAKMCYEKGWAFTYYTKPLSKRLSEHQEGNFAIATQYGMEHREIEHTHYKEYIAALRLNLESAAVVVDQGGAIEDAKVGINVLAEEIRAQHIATKAVATPSGTGTTALFLAESLPEYTIYTTPCVGDVAYLQTQMLSLVGELPKNLVILQPKKKYHFAKPYRELYEMYEKTLKAGVEFDLLYAPVMWLTLLEQTRGSLLYIHSGGVSGNATMKLRYEKKFFSQT